MRRVIYVPRSDSRASASTTTSCVRGRAGDLAKAPYLALPLDFSVFQLSLPLGHSGPV